MPLGKITLDAEDIKNVISYAMTHCKDECPAKRDPEKCWSLIALTRKLGLPEPPCVKEWGGFSVEKLEEVIKRIERRRGKPITLILIELRDEGVRSLQDMIDLQEAVFTLQMINVLKKKGEPKP